MNRERLAQIAVRLYPEAGRAERSDELVGTLLDASDDSRAAFARQLRSVVAAGLGARSRAALSEPLGHVGINALVWAAVMALVQGLVEILGIEVRWRGAVRLPAEPLMTLVPAVSLALFTVRRTRLSGLGGLAWVGYWLFGHVSEPVLPTPVALRVLPVAGFALLAFAPDKVSARGRWLWLAPAAVFVVFEVTLIGYTSGVGYLAPVVVALCLLPFQPSFALGTALAWSALGALQLTLPGPDSYLAFSYGLLACTPIAVIAVSAGRRATRRT